MCGYRIGDINPEETRAGFDTLSFCHLFMQSRDRASENRGNIVSFCYWHNHCQYILNNCF